MTSLYDTEFGEILIKTVPRSRHVRLRISPTGTLQATIPSKSAVMTLQRLINDSRDELRPLVKKAKDSQPKAYEHRQKIGASHLLIFEPSPGSAIRSHIHGNEIIVTHPVAKPNDHPDVQEVAKKAIRRALNSQAEHYLPRQLRYLAETHGFSYSKISFGNAKGRWGSCSSSGVIRLNVALMKLPLGLIDYVLLHELAHTKELNHSSKFWALVEQAYPHYKSARKQLKNFTPYI